MYTGITQGLMEVVTVEKKEDLTTYVVRFQESLVQGLQPGASVSIDGVCQTVVAVHGLEVTFQAMVETLIKTTLQFLRQGDWVSVERSVRVGEENGGHPLAGHVFERGKILKRSCSAQGVQLTIHCSLTCLDAIFEKGFVGVDGSSLTVGSVDSHHQTFDVWLIPETLRRTNFSYKREGDYVNIELDPQASIITQALKRLVEPLEQRIAQLESRLHF